MRFGINSEKDLNLRLQAEKAIPHIAVKCFVQRVKWRSSRKVQQEFPALRNRNWSSVSGPEANGTNLSPFNKEIS